jgi:hypothetical protein
VQKEVSAIERRLGKLDQQIAARRAALADHDQSDYAGLAAEMAEIGALEKENSELEERWLELSENAG